VTTWYNLCTSSLHIVSYMLYAICSMCRKHVPVLSLFITYHRVCNYINSMGATTACGAPEFSPGFWWGSLYSIFSFICMLCRSLYVICTFSVGHCVVCSSAIYGLWLPLWYRQVLLAPMDIRFTNCLMHAVCNMHILSIVYNLVNRPLNATKMDNNVPFISMLQ
jgi:hypothetical protein